MLQNSPETQLSQDICDKLFPHNLADRFFDALYGNVEEGAYDIRLNLKQQTEDRLEFEFQLQQRPGKCLACNLTYGLPNVFARHPIIDINGLVQKIDQLLGDRTHCSDWKLGATREITRELHVVPLQIRLDSSYKS